MEREGGARMRPIVQVKVREDVAHAPRSCPDPLPSTHAAMSDSRAHSPSQSPTHSPFYAHLARLRFIKRWGLMRNAVEVQPMEAELHYRLCAYLLAAGRYREAYETLENALTLDFDKHRLLFEYFPELESQKALARLIDQYRK